ncbi:MAG: hypothetical protein GKR93_06480 [Gammaproteobacteria bacterium]|nr:hypothetical protein [Gammaproteobacteria bacterium]
MTDHPLLSSTKSLLPDITAAAESIEVNQRIPDKLIDQIRDAGLFSVAVPKEFGGPELDPLLMFDALELLARADASTAWVTLIISANPYLFGNSLHEHVWQEMYGKDINTCTAGTLMPGGKAVKVEGGYQVTGRFRYGSGSEHCQYLLSGCMVYEGETLCRLENGEPEIRWLIHKIEDCEIQMDSWDSTGLRGSSSHDYVIEDLFVPADWSFVFGETVHKLSNPVFTFPTIPFCQLAAIAVGMARQAIETVREIASTKRRGPMLLCDDPSVQLRVAEADAMTSAARSYVKDVVADLLNSLHTGKELSWEQRARFRLSCTYALDNAVKAVDMMYKNAGGSAVYKPNQLDRMFRDIHTAATHIRFSDLTYIQAGRMLLGLDPKDPLF